MWALLFILLVAEPSEAPKDQCECAEWYCPKEGPCQCVKVKMCPVPKRVPR